MTPQRITLSRAKGWRLPENTIKVDRSTKWGNPFKASDVCVSPSKTHTMGEPIGVAGAVASFGILMANNLKRAPEPTRALLDQLRGKNLACWCKPGEPCHADVLLRIANR